MSWGSGLELALNLWDAAKPFIAEDKIMEAARAFFDSADGDFNLRDGFDSTTKDPLGIIAWADLWPTQIPKGMRDRSVEGDVVHLSSWEARVQLRDGLWRALAPGEDPWVPPEADDVEGSADDAGAILAEKLAELHARAVRESPARIAAGDADGAEE